jgi:photosystem II stability/assembly factor-like uncharacterized protein
MKTTLLAGIFLLVIVSQGYNQNWTIQNCGTTSMLNAIAFGNLQNGIIAGNDGTVLTTNDGGQSWIRATSIPIVDYKAADVEPDTITPRLFIAGQNGVLVSRDGTTGVWHNLVTHTTETLNDILILGGFGFAVGANGTVLKSIDAGETWDTLNVPAAAGVWLTNVSIDPTNPNFITVVGENGFVIQSINGGISWNPQTLPGNAYLGSVVYTGPDKGWASGSEGVLNSFVGSTFTPYNLGTTEGIMGLGFATENFGFGVGDNGYITQWNGNVWTQQTSPTNTWLNDVSVLTDNSKDNTSDYTVYAWAVGQNGMLISTVQTVVGIGDKQKEKIGISPNPTSGKFNLTGAGNQNISLRVFDISGRQLTEISTSGNGKIDLGWLKCGLYTISIQQGSSIYLQKLIIRAD